MPTTTENPLFSTGTTAKLAEQAGDGTFPAGTDLPNLRSITGNTVTMSFSEVTALSDKRIRRRPARLDPGTVSLSFTATDKTVADNQLTTLRAKMEGKKRYKITVDIQGADSVFDDTTPLISFEGYFSSVGTPSINIDDNVLTYEVGFQVD
jgi:hypothetical protein